MVIPVKRNTKPLTNVIFLNFFFFIFFIFFFVLKSLAGWSLVSVLLTLLLINSKLKH